MGRSISVDSGSGKVFQPANQKFNPNEINKDLPLATGWRLC
jgi:hypothetical protein